MISGRQTLGAIDRVLSDERGRMEAVEAQIDTLNQRYLTMQRADAQDYRELACIRVDALADGGLTRQVDLAEQRVLGLIAERERTAQGLVAKLQDAETLLRDLGAERETQADRVDQAAEQVDEAEARTQQRLEADAAYQAQQQRAQAAERMATQARDKAEGSADEQRLKGEAYRGDPLFMYLWQRQYAMQGYKASSLVRWLDGKVARLIGFTDARANFARLNEIPVRLREHADALQAESDEQFEQLKVLDSAAREADGIMALEQQLEQQQHALDELDAGIEQASSARQDLLTQKAAIATGDDKNTRKAIDYLAAELSRDDLQALRSEALATPAVEDDMIVNRMLQRDQERLGLETSRKNLRATLQKHHRRKAELDALRADFKRERFDRNGSSFDDGSLVSLMLNSFINGLLDRRALWDGLREQQRYRPRRSNPNFGSGGFGRGSVWNGGMGDLGDIIGGLGRGGGSSRGGGGGGFRTGGGF